MKNFFRGTDMRKPTEEQQGREQECLERLAAMGERVAALETTIDELKRAGEAVREGEHYYRLLVELAQDVIFVIGRDGLIKYVNEYASRFFGYAKEGLVGRPLRDLFPLEAREFQSIDLQQVFESGESVSVEDGFSYRNRDVYIETKLVPVRDPAGTVEAILGFARDITERMKMKEAIRRQASYDFLTGLPNRMLFMDHLNLALAQAQLDTQQLAALFLDLDRFKNINDSLGYAAGDQVLKDVAGRLRAHLRDRDIFARIGGDEFIILLRDISHVDEVSRIAEHIIEAFQSPFSVNGQEFHLTMSIGISMYPYDSEYAETLLKNADIAMYHAKAQGRNNYQFYNPVIDIRALERMILENSLRQTLKRGELAVYYQPQVDIASRQIVCAEALVRWKHPEAGLLNPMQFIPLAEETGFIIPMDEWVLRTACSQTKAWHEAGYPPIVVTVNLSARQFQQPNLVEMVSRVLKETGLSPESLELEITESIAMQNIELTIPSLSRLNEMGVRLSIDDFGTGYSSLSYLKKLPIQKIKIDKSFISGLSNDPDYKAIVNAVIAMGRKLRLNVVAEGVETGEQLSFLHSSFCDEIQGYLFSRPVPAEEFEELMQLHR
ncbi:MAG: EAL domain-containing protein [Nitrospirota bacterium]